MSIISSLSVLSEKELMDPEGANRYLASTEPKPFEEAEIWPEMSSFPPIEKPPREEKPALPSFEKPRDLFFEAGELEVDKVEVDLPKPPRAPIVVAGVDCCCI